MVTYYLVEGEHVNGEEERSKHRALRHTLYDCGLGGAGVSKGDKLFPIGEI